MKGFIFLIILLTACHNIYAQSLTEKTIITTISQNKDWHTDKPITGLNYAFPGHIYYYFIDSNNNELILVLRKMTNGRYKKEGWLAAIDLNTDSIKWADDIHGFDIFLTKDKLIEKMDDTYYSYNLSDGKFVWKKDKLDLVYTDYESNTGFSNGIVAFDLNTGKKKWKRKINTDYGWDDLEHLDDTTVVLATSGLHSISLNDGSGWDHELKTGNKNYKKTIAIDAAGIATAAVFGVGFFSVKPNVTGGMSSKLLIDNGRVYYASAESITCMDKQGNVIWETPTPGLATGTSKIYLVRNNLILLNKGYIGSHYKTDEIDAPFIASYDKNTGHRIFLDPINNEGPVHDNYLNNDTMLVSFKNAIYKCNLDNGSLQNTMLKDNIGNWKRVFIKPYLCYIPASSDTYTSFANLGQYFILGQNYISAFSSNLKLTDTISIKNFWTAYENKYPYSVIVNPHNTVLIKDGKSIASFGAADQILSAGKKLYMLKGNHLTTLNLNGIL